MEQLLLLVSNTEIWLSYRILYCYDELISLSIKKCIFCTMWNGISDLPDVRRDENPLLLSYFHYNRNLIMRNRLFCTRCTNNKKTWYKPDAKADWVKHIFLRQSFFSVWEVKENMLQHSFETNMRMFQGSECFAFASVSLIVRGESVYGKESDTYREGVIKKCQN